MRIKHISTFTFFLLLVSFVGAQSYMIDSTGKKVETKTVVVHSKPPVTEDIPAKRHEDKNVVKAGLLYFVSGCEPIYYERKIMPWLSVQAGLGLTSRDFVADVLNFYIHGFKDNQGLNPYYRYNARKAQVGVYTSIQPKFYIHNDAFEGFWLGPMLEFKRFDYKANLPDVNLIGDGDNPIYLQNAYQKEYRNALDFTFNVGWQFKFPPCLALEYSMGVGFRRFWEQRSYVNYASSSGPPYYTYYISKYNGYRPEFNMALSFGGFF